MVICRICPLRTKRRPWPNWAGIRSDSSRATNGVDQARSIIGHRRGEADEVEQVLSGESSQPPFAAAHCEVGQVAFLALHLVDALLDGAGTDERVDLYV